jgi:hypothetical protein
MVTQAFFFDDELIKDFFNMLLRFLRHKEMRHITSSRWKQSSFLLDRLHKTKAWSRKFPVEEQGKPICVPNELCSNISTPSHAF